MMEYVSVRQILPLRKAKGLVANYAREEHGPQFNNNQGTYWPIFAKKPEALVDCFDVVRLFKSIASGVEIVM